MQNDANAVRLTVNGRDYAGWLDVSITLGIERMARDFTLAITDRWPASNGVAVRQVVAGALCELWIGGDKVLTGYVDATPVSYDATRVTVGVSGRSKTADLVDCSVTGKVQQWRGALVESIIAALAKPYGVVVKSDVTTGQAPSDFQIDQGETVFEAVDKLLRPKALWATDNADGELVIIKVPGGQAHDALRLGENILGGDAALDFKDRFSEYVCKGQRAGGDDESAAKTNEAQAQQTDATLSRRRVLQIQQSGQASNATCRQRVQFEAAQRFSQSLTATYSVQGWRQSNGALWQPNTRVWVNDPVIGFDDELLITEVCFSLSNSGMKTAITVAPSAGYEIRDPDAPQSKKKARKGKESKLPTDAEEIWKDAPK